VSGVRRRPAADHDGNVARTNHVDRCWCGCKYWRNDRCIDCGDSGDGAVNPD